LLVAIQKGSRAQKLPTRKPRLGRIGIGVSLNAYTKTDLKKKAAAKKLEDSVLGRKAVRIPKRKAS
jgi:hypothetical protein